jgi:hypothetical protein
MGTTSRRQGSGDKRRLSAKRRRRRVYRDTPEVVEGICRQVRAVGERVAWEDAGDLLELVKLRVELDIAFATAIAGLRQHGAYSDADIARVLAGTSVLAGDSKQAVQQRWPRS